MRNPRDQGAQGGHLARLDQLRLRFLETLEVSPQLRIEPHLFAQEADEDDGDADGAREAT